MKVKRVIALVLALTMMFALVAMTVSASTEAARRATCALCGGWDAIVISQSSREVGMEYVSGCDSFDAPHAHIKNAFIATVSCRECFNVYDDTTYYWTCIF